jgi:Na+/H+ antiporter NhaD/arsenite permease-like protein
VVIVGVVIGFFAGFHLGFTTLAGAMVLVLADRKEPTEAVASVDWSLLVFFSSLFVVVSALGRTGYVASTWLLLSHYIHFDSISGVFAFSGLITIGANLVSNVPLVLLTGPFVHNMPNNTVGWVCLAFASTIAGNLTLVGSVANIIVAEGAKDHYTLGFMEYLKFGLVSTLLVIVVGIPVIWGMIRLLG